MRKGKGETGDVRELHVEHGESLYALVLSAHMYPPLAALWELVKNGWDACVRKMRSRGCPKGYKPTVSVNFVDGHPLSRDGLALVIEDNGEGLTEPSLERFLKVGCDEEDSQTTGALDQKRIGRIAAFALLSTRKDGFWLLSATSGEGRVQLLHVTPRGLAKRVIEQRFINRDDTHLNGICPKGSFTMIVLPNVVSAVRNVVTLIDDLKWRIPRRPSTNSFTLKGDGRVVTAPPLARELVITEGNIVGHFQKDERLKPEGIRICDAETGVQVAKAPKMAEGLPFPLARPEVTGDLFIPELFREQNTDRSGLSPVFLHSERWRLIQELLFTFFSSKLAKLLGDEGVIRSDPLGRAVRQIVSGFNNVWGAPDAAVPIPKGVTPPPGFADEDEGKDEHEPDGGSGSTHRPRKPRKNKQRVKRINYKGKTYVLGLTRQDPTQTAEFCGPNMVFVNSQDPLLDRFKSAPAALQLHVLRGIINAIERVQDENIVDASACERAVNGSVTFFYVEIERKRA